jgi:hypothetical protein
MALVDFWNSNKEDFSKKHVQQLIAIAGEGRLCDGSVASLEFRALLNTVPSANLATYSRECLEDHFDGSGLALQDIVNQIGRRLAFRVEDGLYRGKQGTPGHDGIWELRNGHKIIVEVKTTDAYSINLDTIAFYRRQLIKEGKAEQEKTSILMVVGRKDTGGLEAQIRGSRYAWDIRIISVDALIRLMGLKESLDDPHTVSRISELLVPKEYTKLDDIIDLVFATAEEVSTEDDSSVEEPEDDPRTGDRKPKFTPVRFHDKCMDRIEATLATSFIKESRTLYRAPLTDTRVLVAVSREHGTKAAQNYWFAFHPHQLEELKNASSAYVAFGCGSADKLFLIPLSHFEPHLSKTWTTERDDRMYWHVRIQQRAGKHQWALKKGSTNVDIDRFLVQSKHPKGN